jgi:hypothetical protein
MTQINLVIADADAEPPPMGIYSVPAAEYTVTIRRGDGYACTPLEAEIALRVLLSTAKKAQTENDE